MQTDKTGESVEESRSVLGNGCMVWHDDGERSGQNDLKSSYRVSILLNFNGSFFRSSADLTKSLLQLKPSLPAKSQSPWKIKEENLKKASGRDIPTNSILGEEKKIMSSTPHHLKAKLPLDPSLSIIFIKYSVKKIRAPPEGWRLPRHSASHATDRILQELCVPEENLTGINPARMSL
ncbi:hypothetical protein RRG08_035442 [Elysia crispata]|uniref:Uncharacterized protein n=1 Tax=Elysia crispata TaxID=231223 RepID=A0AAE0Y3H0_9GAST|nr:hypothetical protein RRG08_035442 [Elysia crispata]